MRVVGAAIVGVVVLVTLLHLTKPSLIYTENGRVRDFGVGWRQKTVVPLWLAVLLLAILSYSLSYLYIDEGVAAQPLRVAMIPHRRLR
jgi:membrane protease YdiL (CAAX protease family)